MRSRPSLTVYIIARIDMGIMRHRATSCDIVRQRSGVDSRRTGDYRLSRGRNKHSIQDGLFGTQRKTVERAKGSSPKDRSEPSSLTLPL